MDYNEVYYHTKWVWCNAASQYLFVSYNVNCFFFYFILKGNRDESTTVDLAKAQKEAQDLFQV